MQVEKVIGRPWDVSSFYVVNVHNRFLQWGNLSTNITALLIT